MKFNFLSVILTSAMLVGVVAPGAGAPAAPATQSAAKRKLNVLMIAVDDLRPQMGCYGDPDAVTPHMDSLAGRGIVFDCAYCQQAVCNPSRASLMTGLRPDTLRVWDLGTHFRKTHPEVVTLPQYFKQHGYHTECIGKIYHDPRSHRDAPSWSVEEKLAFTDEVGGKYALEQNLEIYGPPEARKKAAATECADVPDHAYIDGQVADAAVESLRALADRPGPFFLAVGFRRPHLPFSAPKKYWDMQNPARIARVPNPLPPVDVPPIALHDSRELRGYTDIPDLGELSPEQVAHLRHGYYAAMSFADAQIGKVLAELDRAGLRDSTLVCLWGDHGWHLGEHGLWGKTTNFELDTRSPLMLAGPGWSTAGSRSKSLVEFVDVFPTLVELCGLPPAEGLEGISLVNVLRNPEAKVRDAALSQFPRTSSVKPRGTATRMGYSLRTDEWRYAEWTEVKTGQVHERELYDHKHDPRETVNLAGRPEHAETIARLGERLQALTRKRPISP